MTFRKFFAAAAAVLIAGASSGFLNPAAAAAPDAAAIRANPLPASLRVEPETGLIRADLESKRFVVGCWEDGPKTFEYKNEAGEVVAVEVCNEPDQAVHGRGETAAIRAQNYYDFLSSEAPKIREKNPKAKVILGSLSGYNFDFLNAFLSLPNACQLIDAVGLHPYQRGLEPGKIDTSRDAWHTASQRVEFARHLSESKCNKKIPIWVTEFGFATQQVDAENPVPAASQGDFAIRQLVTHLSQAGWVSYFQGGHFQLDASSIAKWNDIAAELAGSRFIRFETSGDSYCPRGGNCFYDDSQFRAAFGESFYGLPAAPKEMKTVQTFTFHRPGQWTRISWTLDQPGISIATEPAGTFWDVDLKSNLSPFVETLALRNIISGNPNGSYQPQATINRAEFAKIALLASKTSLEKCVNSGFADIPNDAWFTDFICTAANRGIIAGYPDGFFRPADPVNHAEAAKIVAVAFGVHLPNYIQEPEHWYDPYFQGLAAAGMLPENFEKQPGELLTRGELAYLLTFHSFTEPAASDE